MLTNRNPNTYIVELGDQLGLQGIVVLLAAGHLHLPVVSYPLNCPAMCRVRFPRNNLETGTSGRKKEGGCQKEYCKLSALFSNVG